MCIVRVASFDMAGFVWHLSEERDTKIAQSYMKAKIGGRFRKAIRYSPLLFLYSNYRNAVGVY